MATKMLRSSSHKISPITNQTSQSDSSKISSPKSKINPSDSSTTDITGRPRHHLHPRKNVFGASGESSNSSLPTAKTNQIDSSKDPTSDLKKLTFSKIRGWICDNSCFCPGVLFASGLALSDMLIDYSILQLLITYIEDDDSNSTAILVMIQDGISTFLEIFMTYISIAIFSRFQVIFVSSFFYFSGLLLFFLRGKWEFSTINVLLFFLRSRGKWEISTINVIGILLLAVGHAGVQPLIREFVFDQYRNHERNQGDLDRDRVTARARALENTWYHVVRGFSALAAFVTYSYGDQSGPTTLMVSLVATGGSLIFFVYGTRYYHPEELGQSPDTCRSRFVTSFRNLTASANKLFSRRKGDPNSEEPKKKIWKRWWAIFLFFGLVLSGGTTFFPYQGENMNHSKYLSSLVVMKSISSGIISFLFEILHSKYAKKKKVILVRIGVGMLTCIPCFLVARRIELVRLSSEKRSEKISMFWLVPQFCMLGFIEGLAKNGLDEFVIGLFPDQRKEYVSTFNTLVIGLGSFANGLLFSTAVNNNHLPRYFLILTIISLVISFIYSVVSIHFYNKTKNTLETSEAPENSELDRVNDCLDQVNTAAEDLERSQNVGMEYITDQI